VHEGIATHLDFREQKKPRSRLIARMGKYVGLSENVESGLEALDADCLKFARKRRNNPHDNVSHTALITTTNIYIERILKEKMGYLLYSKSEIQFSFKIDFI
jgi:predicted RNA-binding protein with PIN domain